MIQPDDRPDLQRGDHVLATTARKVEQIHRQAWFADPRVRATCQHERRTGHEDAVQDALAYRREEVMP